MASCSSRPEGSQGFSRRRQRCIGASILSMSRRPSMSSHSRMFKESHTWTGTVTPTVMAQMPIIKSKSRAGDSRCDRLTCWNGARGN